MSDTATIEQTNANRATVSLTGVKHVYEDVVHALGPIDLDLRLGEFFTTIGPSGCGKTTMMDIVAGLTPPTEGEVIFEDEPVRGEVPEGVGIVFQDDASFPWLTVWNNIAFGLRRAGRSATEVKERVDYAIDFMGLQ